MTWQAGQSGNPKGMLPGSKDVKAEALAEYRAAQKKAALRVIKALDNEDDDVAMRAAKEIFDRLDGKPKQSIDNNHSGELITCIRREVVDGRSGTKD